MRVLGKKVISSEGSLVGRIKDLVLLSNGDPVYIVLGGRKKHYALLPQDIVNVGDVIVAETTYKVNLESQFEKALFIFSKNAKAEVVERSGYYLGKLRSIEIDGEQNYPKIILKNREGETGIPCSRIWGERDDKVVVNPE
jgi:sporulation protein YlmC with PRC-barrel domain